MASYFSCSPRSIARSITKSILISTFERTLSRSFPTVSTSDALEKIGMFPDTHYLHQHNKFSEKLTPFATTFDFSSAYSLFYNPTVALLVISVISEDEGKGSLRLVRDPSPPFKYHIIRVSEDEEIEGLRVLLLAFSSISEENPLMREFILRECLLRGTTFIHREDLNALFEFNSKGQVPPSDLIHKIASYMVEKSKPASLGLVLCLAQLISEEKHTVLYPLIFPILREIRTNTAGTDGRRSWGHLAMKLRQGLIYLFSKLGVIKGKTDTYNQEITNGASEIYSRQAFFVFLELSVGLISCDEVSFRKLEVKSMIDNISLVKILSLCGEGQGYTRRGDKSEEVRDKADEEKEKGGEKSEEEEIWDW